MFKANLKDVSNEKTAEKRIAMNIKCEEPFHFLFDAMWTVLLHILICQIAERNQDERDK